MRKPLVSIVIVNFNGIRWLKKCLTSLSKQTYTNFEIIFVDNGSIDESVNFVAKNFPKVKIIQSDKNLGFAGGNNLGVKHAKGDYLLLLNNDIYVDKDFVKTFVDQLLNTNPRAIGQSKIVLMDKPALIDSCGSYWTDSSFLYYIGNTKAEKLSIYNKAFEVFSTKGASNLIPKTVVSKIGLFDPDFWSYYEETDFCHRAWIAGFECWYLPKAKVFHGLGGTSLTFKNSFIQYHNFKNKLCSFLKNFQISTLVFVLPTFILLNIFLSILWLLQGKFMHALSLYRAIYWNVWNLPSTLRKRAKVQRLRVVSDKQIFKKVKRNPGINYYLSLFSANFEDYKDNL